MLNMICLYFKVIFGYGRYKCFIGLIRFIKDVDCEVLFFVGVC